MAAAPYSLTKVAFFDTHTHHSHYNQFKDWDAVTLRASCHPFISAQATSLKQGPPSRIMELYPAPTYDKIQGLRQKANLSTDQECFTSTNERHYVARSSGHLKTAFKECSYGEAVEFCLQAMTNILNENLRNKGHAYAQSLTLLARIELALGFKIIAPSQFSDFMTLSTIIDRERAPASTVAISSQVFSDFMRPRHSSLEINKLSLPGSIEHQKLKQMSASRLEALRALQILLDFLKDDTQAKGTMLYEPFFTEMLSFLRSEREK